MVTLVVVTAALLAVTLVAALATVLVLAMQTRAFIVQTYAALVGVEEATGRLAGRLERVQGALEAAARELAAGGS